MSTINVDTLSHSSGDKENIVLNADGTTTLTLSGGSSGDFVKLDGGSTAQTIKGSGGLKLDGPVSPESVIFTEPTVSGVGVRATNEPAIYLSDNSTPDGGGPVVIRGGSNHHVSANIIGTAKGTTQDTNAICLKVSGPLDGRAPDNLVSHRHLTSYIPDVDIGLGPVTRTAKRLDHFFPSTAYFTEVAAASSGIQKPESVSGMKITNSLKSRIKPSGSPTASYTCPVTYGIKGEMSDTNGEDGDTSIEVYHLCLTGKAPNFIAGNTYIGGDIARSTLALWKSTLSEEQLEQYEAGTVAVPANVSSPGDGTFARQWWYDQQDAETQALIDAGEFAYPTNLLPDNFKDNFALGDFTAINLLSNGIVGAGGFGFNTASNTALVGYRGIVYGSTRDTILSINRPSQPYGDCRVFSARNDNCQNMAGTRVPVPAGDVISFRADSPVGNGSKEYGTYHGYTGFSAASNSGSEMAVWTGVSDCFGFQSGLNAARTGSAYVELANGGSGFDDGLKKEVATSGGTGSALTVNFVVKDGIIQGVNIKSFGSGYTEGDTLTIDGYAGAEIVWHEAGGGKCFNFYASGDANNYFQGSVGIGTKAPTQKLDVAGNVKGQSIYLANSSDNTSTRSRTIVWEFEGVTGARFIAKRPSGGAATDTIVQLVTGGRAATDNANVTEVDSAGNWGFGYAAGDITEKVNVNGNVKANNVTIPFDLENPDNFTTTTEEYEETIEEQTVTKTREVQKYTGPMLDVKETLLDIKGALEGLKTAAASATTCDELRDAIATALSNL